MGNISCVMHLVLPSSLPLPPHRHATTTMWPIHSFIRHLLRQSLICCCIHFKPHTQHMGGDQPILSMATTNIMWATKYIVNKQHYLFLVREERVVWVIASFSVVLWSIVMPRHTIPGVIMLMGIASIESLGSERVKHHSKDFLGG